MNPALPAERPGTTRRQPALELRLSFRPEQPDDQAFLFELYASTRREELEAWGWPESLRAEFLNLQFLAQQGYRREFPEAEFGIILRDGQRIGRWIVDRTEGEIRLVDIALLPENRNAGLGGWLLRRLQAEAEAAGRPLRLTVRKGYRAARLYQRLGFVRTGGTEVHDEMEWPGSEGSRQTSATGCERA